MEFNATFLIAAISFILFVIIMNYIFYKPIEKIINKRESFIDENFDEAKKNNLVSKKLSDQYDKKIEEANSNGKAILNDKSQTAKLKKEELISNAKTNAIKNISDNQNELNKTFDETKVLLNSEVNVLADEIAQKLFGKQICNGGGDNQ